MRLKSLEDILQKHGHFDRIFGFNRVLVLFVLGMQLNQRCRILFQRSHHVFEELLLGGFVFSPANYFLQDLVEVRPLAFVEFLVYELIQLNKDHGPFVLEVGYAGLDN